MAAAKERRLRTPRRGRRSRHSTPPTSTGTRPTGAGVAGAARGRPSRPRVGELLRPRRGAAHRERGRARGRRRRGGGAPPRRPRRRRRRRSGSRAWARRAGALPRALRVRAARAMTAGGGGDGPDPGRLHLPRAVHRPRPHVRPDGGHARRATSRRPDLLQGRSPAPRPRLALRRRPRRPRIGAVLRGRRPQAAHGPDRPRWAPAGWPRRTASTSRATARASTPTIPDPRNDENLAVAQTHLAFIRFHNRVVDELRSVPAAPALHARPPPGRQALPVDDPPRLPAPHLRPGRGRRRVRQRAQVLRARGGGRPTCPRCRSSSPWPRSGSGTAWSGATTTGTGSSTAGRAR